MLRQQPLQISPTTRPTAIHASLDPGRNLLLD
jgi:hypothetical protein